MAAGETAARLRAQRALDGLTNDESRLVYCREYSVSGSGSSTSLQTRLHHQWVKRHDLACKDSVLQFYDEETGALVILPTETAEREIELD